MTAATARLPTSSLSLSPLSLSSLSLFSLSSFFSLSSLSSLPLLPRFSLSPSSLLFSLSLSLSMSLSPSLSPPPSLSPQAWRGRGQIGHPRSKLSWFDRIRHGRPRPRHDRGQICHGRTWFGSPWPRARAPARPSPRFDRGQIGHNFTIIWRSNLQKKVRPLSNGFDRRLGVKSDTV